MSRLKLILCLVFVSFGPGGLCWSEEVAIDIDQRDFFETKIRPVLVSECYGCHSVDAAKNGKLRGELLLDSRESTLNGGESGPAVVPGNPDESLLISSLKHESFEMPPKGKLDDAVIDDFVKWVEMGAPDPRDTTERRETPKFDIDSRRSFWSFQKLSAVQPPVLSELPTGCQVSLEDVQQAIDRFVVAKQQEHQLSPSPVATARVLIRRAWFDLLGLPPTPEQMQHWTQRLSKTGEDGSTTIDRQAWSELVQFLLDQPQYGERWARHWMDVARFAESHGYEQDYDRPTAYHYRDFLIKAFNQDLPYDQFVQWQLAGDELAPEEPLAWMATGFLAGGAFPTQLTEAEFESARYDELDDMVGTTGVAFLGLSVACARCHDHKFDPISARDYYQMAATFTTAIRTEKTFDLEPEQNQQRRAEYESQLAAARQQLEQYDRDQYATDLLKHLTSTSDSTALSPWQIVQGTVTSTSGTVFQSQADGSLLATGDRPVKDQFKVAFVLPAGRYSSLQIEALADPSLPHQGPGRGDNGNFSLTDIRLSAADGATQPPRFVDAAATFEQNNTSLSARSSIDDDPDNSGWAVDGRIGSSQAAAFTLADDLVLTGNQAFVLELKFNHGSPRHTIGRLRVSTSALPGTPPAISTDALPADLQAPVQQLVKQLKAGETTESLIAAHSDLLGQLKPHVTKLLPRRASLVKQLQDLESAGPQVNLTKVLVTSEGLPHLPHHADGRGFPHFYPETSLLRRGDVNQKVEVVQPGFLTVLLPKEGDLARWQSPAEARSNSLTSYRRSALARWLTDVEHGSGHLAARVIVNRLWQHHFGRGLVATPNDFGASGDAPTHPELLDWLAQQLIDKGWSLKKLHHQIMTSHTYMQGDKTSDDARLAIDLENRFFWHRAPQRLEAEAIRDSMLAVAGQLSPEMYGPGTLDRDMRRRSVYFFIKRSQLIPEMMLFDWPEHLVSIGQRPSTTIAPQALMFINSPQGRGYAAGLAKRIESPDVAASIAQAFNLTVNREPTNEELSVLTKFLESQTALRRSQNEADAPAQAMTDLCQMILSMNEFIYID